MTEPVDRFQPWLDQVCARPLPANPMARVRLLAKELAEGAVVGVWSPDIRTFRGEIMVSEMRLYFETRWGESLPNILLLIANGYLENEKSDVPTQTPYLVITQRAFDLLEEAEPAQIFISYRRSESSAFALLVLARLKMAGLAPFLDLSLTPGEDWQEGLRERIRAYNALIVLLGPQTLKSEVVLQEIGWAIDAGLTIIPVWHGSFQYRSGEWDVPLKVDRALSATHTIRVTEESALGYNNAVVELLNRFGVTP